MGMLVWPVALVLWAAVTFALGYRVGRRAMRRVPGLLCRVKETGEYVAISEDGSTLLDLRGPEGVPDWVGKAGLVGLGLAALAAEAQTGAVREQGSRIAPPEDGS